MLSTALIANTRPWVHSSMMALIKPTYLTDIQNTVVSLKMPLFGLQIQSSLRLAHRDVCFLIRPWRGVLQAFSRHCHSSLHAIRTSGLPLLLTNHLLTVRTRLYHQLAMLSSMRIHPPRICTHRCKALVVIHLCTLPPCLPLCRHLVFPGAKDCIERGLSNIWQNRMFHGFPSWI